MARKFLFSLIVLIFSASFIAFGYYLGTKPESLKEEIIGVKTKIEKPLQRYTIENLSKNQAKPGKIEILEVITEDKNYTSYLFSYEFDPAIASGNTKKTTGLINIPNDNGLYPVLVMSRGYVDQEIYTTGVGTRRSAEVYASNGFITIAPDFLGYADSDSESSNIFETRFQTYTTILSILSSLESYEASFIKAFEGKWDKENIFLWGHSNGGQINLTALEVTGRNYPTTLWAPVTKPFPYAILYFTDESEDRGKFIRSELSKFEEIYDTDNYSIENYFDQITAPIQIHQGTADGAVPQQWSDDFVKIMEKIDKDITYYKYSGADHNMVPNWNTVVRRDLEFFRKHLN